MLYWEHSEVGVSCRFFSWQLAINNEQLAVGS